MAHAFTVMLCAMSVHLSTSTLQWSSRLNDPNGGSSDDYHAPKDATPTGQAKEEACDSVSRFMVGQGNCVHNNLNGKGPDPGGEESMVFANVFPFHHERIDLRIKAVDGQYVPYNVSNNGEKGFFMSINVKCGTTAVLDLDLVDGHTGEPREAPYEWMFSIFDFDAEASGAGKESVSIRGFDEVIRSSGSRVAESVDGIFTKFSATREGEIEDNPLAPWNLTEFQKDDTVTLLYSPRFELRMKLQATECKTGRNFEFSGTTGLGCPWKEECDAFQCPRHMGHRLSKEHGNGKGLFCKRETCGDEDIDNCCVSTTTTTTTNPCGQENMLSFKNLKSSNLGGLGPDTDAEEAIIFENVFPALEKQVDLAILEQGGPSYKPGNISRNGLVGDLFQFNVMMDSWVRIKFEFRHAGTQRGAQVPPFYFTIADIDQRAGGGGQESVKISKFESETLCPHTTLVKDHTDLDGNTHTDPIYRASKSGDLDDNPTDAMNLSFENMQTAVTFGMPELYNFFVTVAATAREPCQGNCKDKETGRNVLFAGASSLVCHGSQ